MTVTVALSAALMSAAAADAAQFKVTTVADANDGSCTASKCTLRDAITASNNVAGPNTLTLIAGHYKLSLGELLVTKSVSISGPGLTTTTIDGQTTTRLFEVQSSANLSISGATLANGFAPSGSPTVGGAVFDNNGGSLTFSDCAFTNNVAAGPTGGGGGAIDTGGSVTLRNTTLSNNAAGGNGKNGFGGAIASGGTLTITRSQFQSNTAGSGGGQGYGGAVNSGAAVSATDTSFSSNSAGSGGFAEGGAILASTVTLTRTSVTGNTAGGGGTGTGTGGLGEGGGVSATGIGGTSTITNSNISGNSAGGNGGIGDGGGLVANVNAVDSTIANNHAGGGGGSGQGGGIQSANQGSVLTNTTVSGNTTGGGGGFGQGGGVYGTNSTPTTLLFSTVANNSAPVVSTSGGGGGISGPLTTKASIIADNVSTHGANCDTAATSQGHNLASDTSCGLTGTGDKVGQPLLAPLASNGGLTPTRKPAGNSPAVNHGGATGCTPTDQRGVIRPQGPACDIGSYELAPPSASTGPAKIKKGFVTLKGTASNPDVLDGGVHFQFGKTTSYGSRSPSLKLLAGIRGATIGTTLLKLTPGKTYHYRLVASNPDGTRFGADHRFKTPPAPILMNLKLHPTRFLPDPGNGPSIVAKTGATISYHLSQAATTTFTVIHDGHKVGTFSHHDHAGKNHFHFTGRVNGKPLKPGSYLLKLIPLGKNGWRGPAAFAHFKIA